VVGTDPLTDVAVVKIEANGLTAAQLGESQRARVGEWVLAVGNPLGANFTFTVTSGIISAKGRGQLQLPNRVRTSIQDFIQTDAAINPGNSGGPLLDSAGRLIGINTMIFSPSGAYAGVGFAVPIDTVNRVVPRLITYGEYVRPTLGITANDEVSRRLLYGTDEKGVVVLQVAMGSPAERAGLRAAQMARAGRVQLGDVIVGIDGKPIDDFSDLVAALDAHQFGDGVTLTVRRNGQRRDVAVTLSAADAPGTL